MDQIFKNEGQMNLLPQLKPFVAVIDSWFILGAVIAHAPQVCSPTQPQSLTSLTRARWGCKPAINNTHSTYTLHTIVFSTLSPPPSLLFHFKCITIYLTHGATALRCIARWSKIVVSLGLGFERGGSKYCEIYLIINFSLWLNDHSCKQCRTLSVFIIYRFGIREGPLNFVLEHARVGVYHHNNLHCTLIDSEKKWQVVISTTYFSWDDQ